MLPVTNGFLKSVLSKRELRFPRTLFSGIMLNSSRNQNNHIMKKSCKVIVIYKYIICQQTLNSI